METNKLRVVVLGGGSGTTLDALARYCADASFPAEIVGVVSDRPAGIEEVAELYGLPSKRLDMQVSGESLLLQLLHNWRAQSIWCLGWMRILGPGFLQHVPARGIFNLHPSLLPAFKGLNTHRRALEAGAQVHGATIHLVRETVDDGPIVGQAWTPVLSGVSPGDLEQLVKDLEHRLVPMAVELVARAFFDQHPPPPRLTIQPNGACFSLTPRALLP